MIKITKEQKLESALKRKSIIRETLHNTAGYKAKTVKVDRIDQRWYGFNIDGNYFECKWDSIPSWKNNKVTFWFRNNKELESGGFCYEYGISADRVKYASSIHFGRSSDIIPCLWLIGEVLEKKSSYDFSQWE